MSDGRVDSRGAKNGGEGIAYGRRQHQAIVTTPSHQSEASGAVQSTRTLGLLVLLAVMNQATLHLWEGKAAVHRAEQRECSIRHKTSWASEPKMGQTKCSNP